MSFYGQGQIQCKCLDSVIANVILYEDNPLNNNNVIANDSKIQAHYTVISEVIIPC